MKKTRRFSMVECVIVLLLLLIVAISFCVYICQFHSASLADAPEEFAWFGDYVGGVIGPITALIGIVFLYRTYKIQLDISATQEKIQQKQQFEDTFFSLLGQQRNIVTNIKGKFSIGNGQSFEEKTSYEYVSQLRTDLANQLQVLNFESDALASGKMNILKKRVNDIYSNFFSVHAAQLGHYFRHLYHLLKFIQYEENINKRKYFDLIQAQMTYDELYLIAINGISNYGREKMLPILDTCSFLENLAVDDDQIVRRLIELFYPSTKTKDVKHIKKNIIFIGGVHCVGKTTFMNKLKTSVPIVETLSCSEVLKWENPSNKNVEDIEANQNRLIDNLFEIIDIDKPYLLDGHFCLLNNEDNVERVGIGTFRDINPEMIILLVDSLDTIRQRLSKRDKKEYELAILKQLVDEESRYAKEVAESLEIPCYELRPSEYEQVLSKVERFASAFGK